MWAFIIAVIALVVAIMVLPTVFQMIWGKPLISIKFSEIDSKDNAYSKILECELINLPLDNPILRQLGVYRRTAEGVAVLCSISEGINPIKAFVPSIPSLPSNFMPFSFPVICVDKKGSVFIFSQESQHMLLPSGLYTIGIIVTVEGITTFTNSTKLIFQTQTPYAHWSSVEDSTLPNVNHAKVK